MPVKLGRAEGADFSTVQQVFTDGGLLSANPSRVGGTWAFCYVDREDRLVGGASGVVLLGETGLSEVSNNTTELLAMLLALEQLPDGWEGDAFSDNETTRIRCTYAATCKMNGVPGPWVPRFRNVVDRLGGVVFHLLGGHPTKADLIAGKRAKDGMPVSKWNVWCDLQCESQAKRFRLDAANHGGI